MRGCPKTLYGVRAVAIAVGVGLGLGALTCAADIPGYPPTVEGYDSREVALLPRFCIYTQLFRDKVPGGNNPAQFERLLKKMGPGFMHMHHYCWGLMRTNRALLLARTPQDRDSNLRYSINEFDYVVRNAPPNFVMLPEVLTKRGENLILLNRVNAGLVDLHHAIKLKADHWPAYAAISDYYKASGERDKAREWLEKGLAAAPNARALTERLAKLDGSSGARKRPATQR